MSWRDGWRAMALACPMSWAAPAQGDAPAFGRVPTPAEVASWNIDVTPDGAGLPPGSGTVARGLEVYVASCQGCHGEGGQGGFRDRLAGGIGSLATAMPVKTVGSYWPYATTVFDYLRRAMPYQAPQSLGDDDYYALTAYLLHLNGIVPADAVLDQHDLAQVRMPNRDGFVPEPEFRRITNARQRSGKARAPSHPPPSSPLHQGASQP